MSGTYALLIDLARDRRVEVGALGAIAFDAGSYAYVGSAFGPSGFARVDRHRELARGEREARHWHVDYLLGAAEATLERTVFFPDEDRECELASTLPGDPIADFGASDCDCESHLLATDTGDLLAAATDRSGVLEPAEEANVDQG